MPESILRVEDIEHFHWTQAEADAPVTFSSNGCMLSLAAAVELQAIELYSGRADNTFRSTIRVANCATRTLLRASRWPARKSATKLRRGDTVVIVLPSDEDGVWWSARLRELISDLKDDAFPVNLARALTGAVAEMVDNIWLHSDAQDPGLVAYQVRRRKFAFSVLDTGIGVLASLRKNPRYQWLNSSMDGIKYAIQPGVSRFDGGGMGFPSLLHALADLWGNARLRTGEASLHIDRTQDQRKIDFRYLPHLPGLHVSARCALDPPKII